jgi:hypothetical protein
MEESRVRHLQNQLATLNFHDSIRALDFVILYSKEMLLMNNRYNYGLNIDGNITIIESDCDEYQFEKAVEFAKTLPDYNTDNIKETLKSAGFFAEYIHIDHEFNF